MDPRTRHGHLDRDCDEGRHRCGAAVRRRWHLPNEYLIKRRSATAKVLQIVEGMNKIQRGGIADGKAAVIIHQKYLGTKVQRLVE